MVEQLSRTYRIGEAARLLEIESHVLRYWEREFSQLTPLRTAKGQRLYAEEHLALVQQIKHLLYEEGLTIDGARKILERSQEQTVAKNNEQYSIQNINQQHIQSDPLFSLAVTAQNAEVCAVITQAHKDLHYLQVLLSELNNDT